MPRTSKIRVVIVDDIADTRENIQKLLFFEKDIEVVGAANDGQGAIQAAIKYAPDIIVMDIAMPGIDGISAVEGIRKLGLHTQVIMMSVQEEQEYLRRSMLAGAREFLIKPFSGEEIALAIRRVFERSDRPTASAQSVTAAQASEEAQGGNVITLFSPKGGVGRTTIACNLACALKMEFDCSVALVDCSLSFGDVGIFLNVQPTKTVIDVLPHIASLDSDLLHDLLLKHHSGIEVMLAPSRPEMAELVTPDGLKRVISKLREAYDYVVIDTAPSFDEVNLGVLDLSDRILVPLTLEMSAVKNIQLFLEVANVLGYERDKLSLILNRSTGGGGFDPKEIEGRLGRPIALRLPTDVQLAMGALNQGKPFVLTNKNSGLTRGIFDLARSIVGSEGSSLSRLTGEPDEKEEGSGGGHRLFRLPWRAKQPQVAAR